MEQEKIQQLQFLEQNLQAIVLQKQSFQMELEENNLAIEEIKKTKDSVYKIVGQLMISAEKDEVLKGLQDKQKLIEIRIDSLKKQEDMLQKQFEDTKQKVLGDLNKTDSN